MTMIPLAAHKGQPDPYPDSLWGEMLANATRDVARLLQRLDLTPQAMTAAGLPIDTNNPFAMRVPEPFIARMRTADALDPLLLQVLPLQAERLHAPHFSDDPLAESGATQDTGLIQKYAGRSLVIATGACAVHCRYCFRRHFPYTDHGPKHYEKLVAAVHQDTSLIEVILSGGDPLVLPDAALEQLLEQLSAPDHVRRVRIHTRLPIVLPQRVTARLTSCLSKLSVPVVFVVHSNHPNELDAQTARAFAALRSPNITLLNQSVLLKGVNDDPMTLARLSETLFAQRVLPYYLHLPDRVQGTAHFFVTTERGREIFSELSGALPGYLVPRLVQELPGASAKEIIAPG